MDSKREKKILKVLSKNESLLKEKVDKYNKKQEQVAKLKEEKERILIREYEEEREESTFILLTI